MSNIFFLDVFSDISDMVFIYNQSNINELIVA